MKSASASDSRSPLGPAFSTLALSLALGFVLLLAHRSAKANCFDDAAAYHHVNANILRAIAWQESHNQPAAKHVNDNGSIDYGVMQINSIHLRRLSQYGVNASVLMEPCKNVYIAAWHLRSQIDRYGNTWAAVGAYHSATPSLRDQYAAQIAHILRSWHFLHDDDDDGVDEHQDERRARGAVKFANAVKAKRAVLPRNSSPAVRPVGLTRSDQAPTVE